MSEQVLFIVNRYEREKFGRRTGKKEGVCFLDSLKGNFWERLRKTREVS